VSLALDPKLLIKALDPELQRNTLFDLKIDDGATRGCLAMVKDVQLDPLRDELMHVDLIRIREDQQIAVKVPMNFTGRSEGVKLGGVLQQVYRKLPVLARADSIPAGIEVDITTWQINDQFRVQDLTLPPGVEVQLDAKQTLASIVAGRAEEELKPAEEVEGAESEKKAEDSDAGDAKSSKSSD
jgi:large subunit ribosomal protein L25